jgi:hypothetical protein
MKRWAASGGSSTKILPQSQLFEWCWRFISLAAMHYMPKPTRLTIATLVLDIVTHGR